MSTCKQILAGDTYTTGYFLICRQRRSLYILFDPKPIAAKQRRHFDTVVQPGRLISVRGLWMDRTDFTYGVQSQRTIGVDYMHDTKTPSTRIRASPEHV